MRQWPQGEMDQNTAMARRPRNTGEADCMVEIAWTRYSGGVGKERRVNGGWGSWSAGQRVLDSTGRGAHRDWDEEDVEHEVFETHHRCWLLARAVREGEWVDTTRTG